MTNNPYILDILSQPESLKTALKNFDPTSLSKLGEAVRSGSFDRILLTGMGGSFYAAYPAWLILAHEGFPAMWIDTAELIHHAPAMVSSKTLLWVTSQSGRSAEIVSILNLEKIAKPSGMLAIVNDMGSPLAKAVASFEGPSACVQISAVPEQTVSTRTAVNTLALGQLTALCLAGKYTESARTELLQTASAMEAYLKNWEARVEKLGEQIGLPKRLSLLGRGPSLASTYGGTLVLAEAAKYAAVPFQAGEFRHGPLELADPQLTALVFGGPLETRALNMGLFNDLRRYNTNAFWVGTEKTDWHIEIPQVPAIGLPIIEILVVQLLSIHFARAIDVEPGHFFRSGKITLSE